MKRFAIISCAAFMAVTLFAAASSLAGTGNGQRGLEKTAVSFAVREIQGFNMRVWLSNCIVAGLQAWDAGSGSQIPLPPHYGLEYPTGSGIEHIYGAGPRIGAIVNGKRIVSEAYNGSSGNQYFLPEFRHLPREHFWRTQTGTPPKDPYGWTGYYANNGILTNTRGCDDDHDGKIDEDDLDGVDNDGDWNPATDDVGADGLPDSLEVSCDGAKYDPQSNPDPAQDNYDPNTRDKCHPDPGTGIFLFKNNVDIWTERNGIPDHGEPHVDEDFAAISDKDLYCSATDKFSTPVISGHIPLGVKIIQKSYAWQGSFADGVLPFDYYFINIGTNILRNVFVGYFADMDIGPVNVSNYYGHDFACYFDSLRTAYMHNPQDRGSTPLGVTVLKTPAALEDLKYIFRWSLTPNAPDDPTDDSIMYSWMSGDAFPGELIKPCQSTDQLSDARLFFSFGLKDHGFPTLAPGETLKISIALVSGFSVDAGPGNMKENAEKAIKLFGRGYVPPVLPQSPSLSVTPGFKKVDLVWGPDAGPIDPTTVWDDSNKIAEGYPDTSWRKVNPPCGVGANGCTGHICTIVNGQPHLPGGRIFEGYRLYRSEDPSDPPLQSSFTLLRQYDMPGDEFEYNTGISTRFTDTNLVRGKTYWYSVTTFGIPDIQIVPVVDQNGTRYDTLFSPNTESSLTENMRKVTLPFSVSEKLNQVLVVPNPYRVDQDYTYENGGWEGRARDWTENSRLLKFIHLPRKCTIRVFTLAGDQVATLPYVSPKVTNPNTGAQDESNIGELTWDILSESNRALASGVYVFTVESDLGTQVGKFVLIR